jgi:Domain of unknown function (DUF4402)
VTRDRIILLLAVGTASTGLHSAAQAASGAGAGRAQLRQPVTLLNTRDLNFGTILRGTTAGRVVINARTGARTSTGGVVPVGTGFSSAAFNGTGSAGRVVTLSIGAPGITVNRVGGGGTMTVNTFRISSNGSGQQTLPRNYTMPVSGTRSFAIGARLNVTANQPDGDYLGSFALTMNYQ